MNAGLHELPLVFFTVLAQSAVGAIILMAVYLLFRNQTTALQQRTVRFLIVPLVLLGLGFLASILHLGSPWRAFNSLNRIGSSALSNEIASGALFFILAGCYWLVQLLKKMPPVLNKLWLVLIIASGILFAYSMSAVYLISTVPTWNNGYTSASFILTAILAGFALAYALLRAAGTESAALRPVLFGLLLALLLSVLLVVSQTFSLADIHTSAQKASALIPNYAQIVMLRVLLLFVGVGLLFYSSRQNTGAVLSLCCAVILVFAAELLGRTLFYGLHMTVGTAIAG